MKSFLVILLSIIFLISFRITSAPNRDIRLVKVTTWDALGYYFYLPGVFIYKDLKKLDWLFEANSKYNLSGHIYQANLHKNGNYVGKYFLGLSFLFLPFFLIAHSLATALGYPADGFSAPYQIAISIAALFYALIALLLLRKVLLKYFTDTAAAITILAVVLGTNFPIYVSLDSALTHNYIFLLFCIQLLVTIAWYKQPKPQWALLSGYLIGLATCCRPTEATMLLVPLFWGEFSSDSSKQKWALVKQYREHILWAAVGGFLGILPQIVYWYYITGNIVYDVGSKWVFLNPWWRVLFGWEKGWFIYTPITIFFVLGFFFIKNLPFKRATIIFFLINTWIIISWFDWRYGGSYSTRALVQSYPVLALALTALVQHILNSKWKYFVIPVFTFLIAVNIFQLYQFANGTIHHDHMNRKYYQSIYLNPSPNAENFSLLDTDEFVLPQNISSKILIKELSLEKIKVDYSKSFLITEFDLEKFTSGVVKQQFLKVEFKGENSTGLWGSSLHAKLEKSDCVKERNIRMYTPINNENAASQCAFYFKIDDTFKKSKFHLMLDSQYDHETKNASIQVWLIEV